MIRLSLGLMALWLAATLPALAQDARPAPENDPTLIAQAAGEPTARPAVRVRGGNHETYGRLVFDWTEKVDYRVGKTGNDLHLAFSSPATFDTEPIMPALRDYVGKPAPGPNGYRIVFPLKGTFQIEDWTSGNKVVIDLKKIAEPSPELTERPTKVRMRVGAHDDFGRLVFDWPKSVGYEVEEESAAGTAKVRFRRPAMLDLSSYAKNPLPQVLGLSPIVSESESGVDLRIPKGARVRHFRDGPRVVVDVLAPKPDGSPRARQAASQDAPEPSEKEAPEPVAQPSAAKVPAPTRKAALKDVSSPSAKVTSEPIEEATDGRNTPAASSEDTAPLPEERPEDRVAMRDGANANAVDVEVPAGDSAAGTQTPDSGEPLQLLPTPDEPESGVAEASANTSADADADVAAVENPDVDTDPILATPARFTPEKVAQGIVPKPRETPPSMESATVPLPWSKGRAAAFRHGGQVWFAVQGSAPEGIVQQIKSAAPAVREVVHGERQDLALLRLEGDEILHGRVEQQDDVWRLRLASELALPSQPIDVEIDGDGTRVRLPVTGPGPAVTIDDPASGGRMVVVPVSSAGEGVALQRRFPEFVLLATQTGIVVVPHADNVSVSLDKGAVIISGQDRPLMLSMSAGRQAGGAVDQADGGRHLLDLESWRRPDRSFAEAKQELQRRLGEAAPANRPLARLDLARFYFAHGMAAETLGALDLYAKDAPRRAEDPQILLMRGASHLLNGDWTEAAAALDHPALEGRPEALPWHAAYAALGGSDAAAVKAFDRAAPFLDAYPSSVRKKFRLWAAESRLAVGDIQGAESDLDAVRALGPNAGDKAEIAFLEARKHAIEDDPEAAEDLWREAAVSDHPPTSARARFVLAERALAAGDRSRQETVEELERLRFAWRGDEFEAVLLHRLADLYVEQAQYNRALDALRQAASHLPNSTLARRAAARMRELFVSLFLDGAADRMPPLKALALYESYRELTPAGARGDEMIARLVDRLVDVDLLTRAAKLLDSQVRHRLDGIPRAEAGTRLAAIRLLDHDTRAAIEALDISGQPDLPGDLSAKRRRLRARALAESGEPDKALALLGDDESEPALQLAADIHSEQGDWSAAAKFLGRLLPAPPTADSPLSEDAAERVMRAAVAMTLGGDTDDLLELSDRFGNAMAKSSHAETFQLLDPSTDGGPVTVAKQLAEVQQAKAFMSSFRDRLETNSTAATQ